VVPEYEAYYSNFTVSSLPYSTPIYELVKAGNQTSFLVQFTDNVFQKPVSGLNLTLVNDDKTIKGISDKNGIARFYFNSSYQANFQKPFYLDVDSQKFSDNSFKLDVTNGSLV